MDEIALAEKQERAAHAERLLGDDLLQEAFKVLHADYISQWLRTDNKDTGAREHLWQAIKILGEVELHLRKVARAGKVANIDLARIKYLKR